MTRWRCEECARPLTEIFRGKEGRVTCEAHSVMEVMHRDVPMKVREHAGVKQYLDQIDAELRRMGMPEWSARRDSIDPRLTTYEVGEA